MSQEKIQSTRDSIFGKNQFKRVQVTLWGTPVEFQQPSLNQILNTTATDSNDILLLNLLIAQTYVPGTQDKVFNSADIDTLKEMPFDNEINKISEVIDSLTGGSGTEKN